MLTSRRGGSRGIGAFESSDEPVAKFDKPRSKELRHQYFRWLWPYRFAIGGLFVLALVAAALDLAWPLALKAIIDLLNSPRPSDQTRHLLNLYGVGILLVLVCKQSTETLRAYRSTVLNSKVIVRLRRRLFHALLHLSMGDLSDLKSGGIVSRLSVDIDSVSGLIQAAMIGPGVAAVRIVLTLAVLCFMSWRLAIAAMVIVPPLAPSSYFWVRRIRPIFQATQSDRNDVDSRVNETFGGIRVVRSFRREPHEERSYAVGHHTIIRKYLSAERHANGA